MRRFIFVIGLAGAVLSSTAAIAAETISYTYDARGRLKQVARSGTPAGNNGVSTSYTYDKADNRTNKTTTGSANPPPP
jgi:YD repeat-containing protein